MKTKYTPEDIKPQRDAEEQLARLMAVLDGCDPELRTTGCDRLLPSTFEYSLWEIRVPAARQILKSLGV